MVPEEDVTAFVRRVEWQPEDDCMQERVQRIEERHDKLRHQVTDMHWFSMIRTNSNSDQIRCMET